MKRRTLTGMLLVSILVPLMGQTGPCAMDQLLPPSAGQGTPGAPGTPGATGVPGPQGPAGPAGVSPFSLQGNDAVYTQGNVGIGTLTPTEPLHVIGNTKVEGTVFASAFSSKSPLLLQTAGTTRIFVDDVTGSVGVGTTTPSPQAALDISGDTHVDGDIVTTGDVAFGQWFLTEDIGAGTLRLGDNDGVNDDHIFRSNGDVSFAGDILARDIVLFGDAVRLGPNGDLFAPAARESLRIVRGRAGAETPTQTGIAEGAGFSFDRIGLGIYRISFNTPFAGRPTVVANADRTLGNRNYAQIRDIQTGFVDIEVFAPGGGGTPVDSIFTFIAMGPR